MKIVVWSGKGGVGKSSITSALLQILPNYQVITNDKLHPYNFILSQDKFFLVPSDKEIPYFEDENLIYDFGGFGDERIKRFIQKGNDLIILIPFNSDIVSYQSAISVFQEIKKYTNNENIFFVLNRSKKGDYEVFKEQMEKQGINKSLLEIKESKLFQNIFNKREKIEDIKNDKLLKHSYRAVLEQMNNLVKEIMKWQ